MGRFINADVFTSTGQGVLGNNMFAYCNNDPTNKADPTGNFGLGVLAVIGGAVGGIIDYAKEVIQNHQAGMSGYTAWFGNVNWGGVVSSVFSGALSVIPGVGTQVLDAVGSTAIEHGINYICSGEFDRSKFLSDMALNLATSAVPVEKISRTGDLPMFIRHIKKETVNTSIKGTRKLMAYLGFRQATHIITNSFWGSTISELSDTYLSPTVHTWLEEKLN